MQPAGPADRRAVSGRQEGKFDGVPVSWPMPVAATSELCGNHQLIDPVFIGCPHSTMAPRWDRTDLSELCDRAADQLIPSTMICTGGASANVARPTRS